MKFPLSLALVSIVVPALGATYSQTDVITGPEFLKNFALEDIVDPTNGRVKYVNLATAQQDGLVSSTSTTFTMRVDNTTVLDPNGPGRNSIRIKSINTYTTHVVVANINHMPQGCATWPAFWEVDEADWPNQGEIDIVEGVNDQEPNMYSLHTGPSCTMPSTDRNQTGTVLSTDCSAADNSNAGCGVGSSDSNSYGPAFNLMGGGWYATERAESFIKVWFWERNDDSVPVDVANPGNTVNTDKWGTPDAYFPDTSCNFGTHFGSLNMIFDITLCGDFAGNPAVYEKSGCPSTCVDFVNKNPSAFSEAYWELASLSIYQ
ncbi:glycoside hydrolase family 16 protein [Piloderma croceum F 1598]|uniref:Glycoside hydrolase family 16 protein n=1 Tax=Piloderma croceum (strain F 1598) TaxID=765440 RepID=A0A0C3ATA1_PILCF|nr:glycoside hydrolase family 16 protein [Piloderma croceum F 1598]